MIPDHFLSTDRRSCRKWNFLLRPWCFYHAAFISFHMTGCSLHHKPDTIDQTHLYLRLCGRSLYCSPRQYRLRKCRLWHAGTAPRQFRQNDLCRLLRDKFRFRCHDRFPSRGLWQLVYSALPRMLILHKRKHHKIHKPFNKCGLSGSHRPHNSCVDLSIGTGIDIPV